MSAEPLYIDLFSAALVHVQPIAYDKCLVLAEATSHRVAGLSNAQISGLAELAYSPLTVEAILDQVKLRERKRWKKIEAADLGVQIEEDINKLKGFARNAVERAERELGRALGNPDAGLRPAERKWVEELHLDLTHRYLATLATLARIEKSAVIVHSAEKES